MIDPAAANQLKLVSVGAATLLLAVFVGNLIGSSDYRPILLATMALLAGSVWFLSGRFFWVLTIASSFLGGTFPILRGSFTPFQIMLIMAIAKFVIEDVILQRRAKLKLAMIDAILIGGFMAVLTYHGINDRFGMRFLGSNVWGGRNYVNVYVGLLAFLVVQAMPMKAKIWNKLPYMILAVTAFDLAIAVVTTVFPSWIYQIYPFYSAVSQGSIDELVLGMTGGARRIGAFGNFGFILILIVLAKVSLRHLFHPSNFFRLALTGIGTVCVLFSGFRSAVAQMLIGMVVAGIRDWKAGVLAALPVAAVFLFALSFINSEVVALPRQVQRGLAFVPGQWDPMMARDAAASNDFRIRTWTLWWEGYFPKQPVLGRGFGFKSDWTKQSIYNRSPGAADYQQMVETGNIHNGFFASLDAIGILGTVFFIVWCIRLFILCVRFPFRRSDPEGFVMRFLSLYLAVAFITYWGGATTLGSFLPGAFALAGVFLRLRRDSTGEAAPAPPRLEHRALAPRAMVPI